MNKAIEIGKRVRKLAESMGLEVTVVEAQRNEDIHRDVLRFIRTVEKAHRLAGNRSGGPCYERYAFAY